MIDMPEISYFEEQANEYKAPVTEGILSANSNSLYVNDISSNDVVMTLIPNPTDDKAKKIALRTSTDTTVTFDAAGYQVKTSNVAVDVGSSAAQKNTQSASINRNKKQNAPSENPVYISDLRKNGEPSTPLKPNIPKGIQHYFDVRYLGAMRVIAQGDSNSNWAGGRLAYNPTNNSLFMVGHNHHDAIAEFKVPDKLSLATNILDIPKAEVLQNYVTILDKKQEGAETDTINGMLYADNKLLVSSEIYYDAPGENKDNLQIFDNAHDLANSQYRGFFQLQGKALAAGYMGQIPERFQQKFGTTHFTGWSSVNAITSRSSQGPSLFGFDLQNVINADLKKNRMIRTTPNMYYELSSGKELVEGGAKEDIIISPLWGPLSSAVYGFFVPNSDFFMVVGSHAGLHSSIGYKIVQNDGNLCGGYCPYDVEDQYNYFWLYRVSDILKSRRPWKVKPLGFGKWRHPFDKEGEYPVVGAAFDDNNNRLFIALEFAAKNGELDFSPLVIAYEITSR